MNEIIIVFIIFIPIFTAVLSHFILIYKKHKKATKNIKNYDALMRNFCYKTSKSQSEMTALLNTRNINDKLNYDFDETTSTITFLPNEIDFALAVPYSVNITELQDTTLVKATQKSIFSSRNLPYLLNDFWTAKIGAEPTPYF